MVPMLASLRRRSAPLAAAVLVAFALGSGATGVHAAHEDGDGLVAVEHDASVHRVTAADSDALGHRLDCLACNCSRSLRHVASAAFTPAPALEDAGNSHAGAFAVLTPARAIRPLLRAPPLSPRSA
jgi:hypothetical protein